MSFLSLCPWQSFSRYCSDLQFVPSENFSFLSPFTSLWKQKAGKKGSETRMKRMLRKIDINCGSWVGKVKEFALGLGSLLTAKTVDRAKGRQSGHSKAKEITSFRIYGRKEINAECQGQKFRRQIESPNGRFYCVSADYERTNQKAKPEKIRSIFPWF